MPKIKLCRLVNPVMGENKLKANILNKLLEESGTAHAIESTPCGQCNLRQLHCWS